MEEIVVVAIIAISLIAGGLTWEDKNGSKKHNQEIEQKRDNKL